MISKAISFSCALFVGLILIGIVLSVSPYTSCAREYNGKIPYEGYSETGSFQEAMEKAIENFCLINDLDNGDVCVLRISLVRAVIEKDGNKKIEVVLEPVDN